MKTYAPSLLLALFLSGVFSSWAQTGNTGIGTTDPQAKLHVAGDLRLLEGVSVNKFSTDSLFTSNSHSVIPTEKAIKDYLKKGLWLGVDTNQVSENVLIAKGYQIRYLNGPVNVDIEGNYAYVVNYYGNSLAVYNITDRMNPVDVSIEYTNLTEPTDIDVQGNYAYVTCENINRLCIFDISNPNNPTAVSSFGGPLRGPFSVKVSGNFAYVSNSMASSIQVVDVSNPAAPVARGSINIGLIDDFVQVGSLLYLTNSGSGRLSIVDVSNPDQPVLRSHFTSGMNTARSVYVKNNYAYVVNTQVDRIHIVNVSNPDAPVWANSINADVNTQTYIRGSGNYIYLNSFGDNIYVYDITTPTAPVLKGYNSTNLSGVSNFEVYGDVVAVPSPGNNRFCLFELDRNRQMSFTSNGVQPVSSTWINVGSNIYNAGNFVGIGTTNPKSRLHVEGDSYLIGNVGIGMEYPSARLGVNGNAYTTGNISIGTSDQFANLTFSNLTGSRIALWSNSATAQYGFGIQGGLLQMYTDQASSDIAFGYGSSTSFTEKMRLKGSGMMGLGTTNPFLNSGATGMHVYNNGYTQLRLESSNNSAGIELKPSTGHSYEIQADNVNSLFVYDRTVGGSAGYRLLLNGSGYLGIGTINPTRPLSFPATLEKKISFYPGGTGDVGISVSGNDLRLYSDNVNARVSFGYDDYVNGFTSRAYVLASGGTAMVVQGQLNVNGTIYNSDIRFKKNIFTIENAMEKVMALRGVKYEMQTENFPDRNFSAGTQVGLIAQEVEQVIPEVVNTAVDGYKSVDYAKLVPVLIEGMKQQQEQIRLLQQEIKELRAASQKK